jgi:hypothetical protein
MNYVLPGNILRIPTTLQVVALCWKQAEEVVQSKIENNIPEAHEEDITLLFYENFAEQLRKMSSKGIIAKAFLTDLTINFPDVRGADELQNVANGLVADVTLHRREAEAITGGDLGLILIRPQAIRGDRLIRIGNYRRGLLCQAKLKRKRGKWGSFTKKQKLVLPQRLHYLSLLLYSYNDVQRRRLQHFQWYLCRSEESLEQVEEYLKKDKFPRLHDSVTIIRALGSGIIGTDNEEILDTIVSRAKNPTLVVKISWPNGRSDPPSSMVYVYSSCEERNEQVNVQTQQLYL